MKSIVSTITDKEKVKDDWNMENEVNMTNLLLKYKPILKQLPSMILINARGDEESGGKLKKFILNTYSQQGILNFIEGFDGELTLKDMLTYYLKWQKEDTKISKDLELEMFSTGIKPLYSWLVILSVLKDPYAVSVWKSDDEKIEAAIQMAKEGKEMEKEKNKEAVILYDKANILLENVFDERKKMRAFKKFSDAMIGDYIVGNTGFTFKKLKAAVVSMKIGIRDKPLTGMSLLELEKEISEVRIVKDVEDYVKEIEKDKKWTQAMVIMVQEEFNVPIKTIKHVIKSKIYGRSENVVKAHKEKGGFFYEGWENIRTRLNGYSKRKNNKGKCIAFLVKRKFNLVSENIKSISSFIKKQKNKIDPNKLNQYLAEVFIMKVDREYNVQNFIKVIREAKEKGDKKTIEKTKKTKEKVETLLLKHLKIKDENDEYSYMIIKMLLRNYKNYSFLSSAGFGFASFYIFQEIFKYSYPVEWNLGNGKMGIRVYFDFLREKQLKKDLKIKEALIMLREGVEIKMGKEEFTKFFESLGIKDPKVGGKTGLRNRVVDEIFKGSSYYSPEDIYNMFKKEDIRPIILKAEYDKKHTQMRLAHDYVELVPKDLGFGSYKPVEVKKTAKKIKDYPILCSYMSDDLQKHIEKHTDRVYVILLLGLFQVRFMFANIRAAYLMFEHLEERIKNDNVFLSSLVAAMVLRTDNGIHKFKPTNVRHVSNKYMFKYEKLKPDVLGLEGLKRKPFMEKDFLFELAKMDPRFFYPFFDKVISKIPYIKDKNFVSVISLFAGLSYIFKTPFKNDLLFIIEILRFSATLQPGISYYTLERRNKGYLNVVEKIAPKDIFYRPHIYKHGVNRLKYRSYSKFLEEFVKVGKFYNTYKKEEKPITELLNDKKFIFTICVECGIYEILKHVPRGVLLSKDENGKTYFVVLMDHMLFCGRNPIPMINYTYNVHGNVFSLGIKNKIFEYLKNHIDPMTKTKTKTFRYVENTRFPKSNNWYNIKEKEKPFFLKDEKNQENKGYLKILESKKEVSLFEMDFNVFEYLKTFKKDMKKNERNRYGVSEMFVRDKSGYVSLYDRDLRENLGLGKEINPYIVKIRKTVTGEEVIT